MNSETFLSDPLLVTARDAALIATTRMTSWRGRLDAAAVDAKDDPNDLVTVADAEIESLVAGYLRTARPHDIMIGEEGSSARALGELPDEGDEIAALLLAGGSGEHVTHPIEWHVDPIDGTVNYVRGIEQHCFSIGGRDPETGDWVVGLVAAPALRAVWFARAGGGAWRTSALPGRVPEGTSVRNPLLATEDVEYSRLSGTPEGRRGRVLATGFSYSPERRAVQLAALGRLMEGFDDIRRAGSAAVDLCYAAEGRVNAYCEYGINVYDWAGGAVVAEEAGLTVQRPHGEEKLCIAADTPERFAFIRERWGADEGSGVPGADQ